MSTPEISLRGRITPPSPIRKLAGLAAAARAKGTAIIPLNIGQPDVETPTQFWEGLAAYHSKVLGYEQSTGSEQLRGAWSHYMARTIGVVVPAENILITSGASEALIFSFMVCCDPGDEIIVPDPTYANYLGFAAVSGVTLVPLHTKHEEGYALPGDEQVLACVTKRTKAILLCNPNNPTGTVYSQEDLARISTLCREKALFLILDETYREIVFDDREPHSILHDEPGAEHIVVVDSLSKRFSMCGARIGCLISANKKLLDTASSVAQARLAAGSLEQFAAAHLLRVIDAQYVPSVKEVYRERRDALCSALSQIPEVSFSVPQGAFYLLAQLPVASSDAFARYLLTEFSDNNETVFLAPAEGFFLEKGRGTSTVRLAYVIEPKLLVRAAEILGCALQRYSA